ncbi:hypothetical protein INS49_012323 [Diaporthe citri]|uniref:uncharacterized protein n=1 Tax=Diaporthe citri TaxID=83186 RepID=UPI001C7F4D50|nr:uncharacterized protein INS49_012323 [Diaporthe citri]KAG6358804.1 hypothetical protein INS49_012323 [Diaporthe citri]
MSASTPATRPFVAKTAGSDRMPSEIFSPTLSTYGRYVVRYKLGHGGFSTVWLASDEQHRDSADRYVAIKIKSGSSSKMGIDADPEVVRLRRLEEYHVQGPQDKPRPYAQLLNCFSVEGPNGRHNCLVTELVGPSLGSVHSLYGQLEQVLRPETILRASKHLLQGVDFIHQAGLVHGDTSAGNVAFTCKSLLNSYDEHLLDLLSEVYVANPWPDKPLPSPRLPKQLVQTARWEAWEDETEEEIRLVDWGSAFPVGGTVSVEVMAQPIDLRSPETFFIGEFDHHHDIWRAGSMIRKLGPLPEHWLPKLEELRKETIYTQEVDENGDAPEGDWELIPDTFELRRQVITAEFTSGDEKYNIPDEHTEYDFEALKSLRRPMQALLQYEPSERATVKDALEMIEWIDHRRETGDDEEEGEDEDEDKNEEGNGGEDD